MKHRLFVYSVFLSLLGAQPPAGIPGDLRFEVASLRLSHDDSPGFIRPAPGGQRYVARSCFIKAMIEVAYRVKYEQIVGGPSWLDTDHYDLQAKAEKSSSADELHVMLMNMLVDRLHLKFHREKREMRMYGLTVDKAGLKITPHEAANAGDPWIAISVEKATHMKMKATCASLDYFAFRLSQFLDLPVVNLTNLKGGYDFMLAYTRDLPPNLPEGGKVNGEEPDTSGPPIFEAVRKQLGLELKAQKGPVDVIVIDHAEKPTEN